MTEPIRWGLTLIDNIQMSRRLQDGHNPTEFGVGRTEYENSESKVYSDDDDGTKWVSERPVHS